MADLSKIALLKQIIERTEEEIKAAKQIIAELEGKKSKNSKILKEKAKNLQADPQGKVIEGIFDGESMISSEGKKYPVPSNYASKSKLVPGDTLKLTILDDGSFIFKQINLVPRKRVIGTMIGEKDSYKVLAGGKAYNVLLASVSYFKAKHDDQVTLVVPAKGDGEWGAIENVIFRAPEKKIQIN